MLCLVYFGACYGLLCLRDLSNKEGHKAATHNCVPKRKGICGDVICNLALCLVCFGTEGVFCRGSTVK